MLNYLKPVIFLFCLTLWSTSTFASSLYNYDFQTKEAIRAFAADPQVMTALKDAKRMHGGTTKYFGKEVAALKNLEQETFGPAVYNSKLTFFVSQTLGNGAFYGPDLITAEVILTYHALYRKAQTSEVVNVRIIEE